MSNGASRLTVADFDYGLPQELIAQTPSSERDSSRLMVVDRATGSVNKSVIRDFPALVRADDVVVVNNTRVLPARLIARKQTTGGRVELLLLHRDPIGVWTCLARPSKSLRAGLVLRIETKSGNEPALVDVLSTGNDGEVQIRFRSGDVDLDDMTTGPPRQIGQAGCRMNQRARADDETDVGVRRDLDGGIEHVGVERFAEPDDVGPGEAATVRTLR